MAILFPLSLPSTPQFSSVEFGALSSVGIAKSPFTYAQQVTVHQGEILSVACELPRMLRPAAEEWIAFLLTLNGVEGTFLLGDPLGGTPRGAWGGTPVVEGEAQTGRSLYVSGLDPFTDIKTGDWIQLGTGTSSRLHKVLNDETTDSSGETFIDVWPRIRSAPADQAAIVYQNAKGAFRLSSNQRQWSLQEAQLYGISFSAMEAL